MLTLPRTLSGLRESLPILLGLAALVIVLAWAIVTLPPVVPPLLVGALFAIASWLLVPGLLVYGIAILSPFQVNFSVGMVDGVAVHDAVFGALLIATVGALLTNGEVRTHRFKRPLAIVLLAFWLSLGIWDTITFLLGPANQTLLADPLRNTWFVYGQIWRQILAFPLVALCLRDRLMARRVMDLILAVSVVVAIQAIMVSWQTHSEAMGPFSSKNGLAGFLALVIPFGLARLLLETRPKVRLLYIAAIPFLFRALWLTASRGGLVAFLASLLPLAFFVSGRRLVTAGTAGVIVVALVAALKGDILDRPNVRRYLTLSSFEEEGTFRWRQEQWKIFLQRVAERPLLGTGSAVDESLLAMGRLATAHNGYLGMAFKSGIPAAAGWLALLMLVGGASVRFARTAADPEGKAFWIGLMGLIAAWLIHNTVDNTLLMPQVQMLFWIIMGVAIVEVSERHPAARDRMPLAGVRA